jgi:hypothetical protein
LVHGALHCTYTLEEILGIFLKINIPTLFKGAVRNGLELVYIIGQALVETSGANYSKILLTASFIFYRLFKFLSAYTESIRICCSYHECG